MYVLSDVFIQYELHSIRFHPKVRDEQCFADIYFSNSLHL